MPLAQRRDARDYTPFQRFGESLLCQILNLHNWPVDKSLGTSAAGLRRRLCLLLRAIGDLLHVLYSGQCHKEVFCMAEGAGRFFGLFKDDYSFVLFLILILLVIGF